MNEDTFCNELRHKFDRIKDKRAEWLPFRYYCMESIETFERLNTEKTGIISQQTLEIVWNYYNDINAIISESRQIPNEQAIQMLTEILEQPTTATQTELTKTDATVIPPPEAPEIERHTVKQSSIAKAVYHFSFTGKPKSKVIADWIFTHCDVTLNDGTPATSQSLAKEITTVKTDDTRRGQKFKLTLELALLATFPPLE